jgi:hypothetical protein
MMIVFMYEVPKQKHVWRPADGRTTGAKTDNDNQVGGARGQVARSATASTIGAAPACASGTAAA